MTTIPHPTPPLPCRSFGTEFPAPNAKRHMEVAVRGHQFWGGTQPLFMGSMDSKT